jgi:uncharacterized protein (DUF2147 family)
LTPFYFAPQKVYGSERIGADECDRLNVQQAARRNPDPDESARSQWIECLAGAIRRSLDWKRSRGSFHCVALVVYIRIEATRWTGRIKSRKRRSPMKHAIKKVLLAALILAFAPMSASAQDARLTGVWLYPNQRFAVAIVPCGEQLCGKIAWLKSPDDSQGQPRVDTANPDPTLRARPMLGLTVLQGLRPVGDHTWDNGTIYNPDDGSHYSATLSVASDGTLHVHAYMMVAMLGKAIVQTRVS